MSRILIPLALSFTFIQCTDRSSNSVETKRIKEIEKENFDDFYSKFHADSVFQLSRIVFPLPGYKEELTEYNGLEDDTAREIDGLEVNAYWQRAGWVIHGKVNAVAEFKTNRVVDDSTVTETIFIPDSDFSVRRKFVNRMNKWYLIYYRD